MKTKKATQWLRYDWKEGTYIPAQVEMGHVPKGQVRPSTKDPSIKALWESISWRKKYGYFDTKRKKFVGSRKLNL